MSRFENFPTYAETFPSEVEIQAKMDQFFDPMFGEPFDEDEEDWFENEFFGEEAWESDYLDRLCQDVLEQGSGR